MTAAKAIGLPAACIVDDRDQPGTVRDSISLATATPAERHRASEEVEQQLNPKLGPIGQSLCWFVGWMSVMTAAFGLGGIEGLGLASGSVLLIESWIGRLEE